MMLVMTLMEMWQRGWGCGDSGAAVAGGGEEVEARGTSSGGGPKSQETMEDTISHTRSENVSKFSNDPLLARGKKGGSRTHKLKRLYKVGRSERVISSNEASLGDQEDASKQGRKIDDIDKDAEITLVDETQGRYSDDIIFDVSDLAGEEVIVAEQGVSDKDVNLSVDEVTLAQALISTDKSKITRKQSKTNKHGHENQKSTKPKPEKSSLTKLNLTQAKEFKIYSSGTNKELIVALRGEIYFVKFIINSEEDDIELGKLSICPDIDPFLEETKEEEKSNDDWDCLLDFNIDDVMDQSGCLILMSKSMNYVPVVASTSSNDFVGTEESIGAGHSSKETRSSQDYILMPLWNDGSLFDSSLKNASNDKPQPSSDAEKKEDEGVSKKSRNDDQERPKNSTQDVNTAGPSINTEPDMFSFGDNATLEATHTNFFGDETEVNMSNITTTYLVPFTPNIRIHKDHSLDYVIGDVQSGVQTRRMTKTTNEQGFINVVYEGKTHEDLHTCLFACFLS
ncbi:hypothetical protein Tco_1500299, partial [Tanacetum coccineum]